MYRYCTCTLLHDVDGAELRYPGTLALVPRSSIASGAGTYAGVRDGEALALRGGRYPCVVVRSGYGCRLAAAQKKSQAIAMLLSTVQP